MAKQVTFNIECTMSERWVNDFCSLLRRMERDGSMGHSEIIGFYSDGDGDFRPKFSIAAEYEPQLGFTDKEKLREYHPAILFDAG